MTTIKEVLESGPSTEGEVHNAFRKIINDSGSKAVNYAVNYAKAGLSMTGHELSVQCLYVLNNITHWRHPEAKECRRILKSYKA